MFLPVPTFPFPLGASSKFSPFSFLPDYIHRPAVAARLVANGLNGNAVAAAINKYHGVAAGTDAALKANTVTKVFTNTLAAAFGKKDWRKDVECMEMVREFGAVDTTACWGWEFNPKGSGGSPIIDLEEVPLLDLCKHVPFARWPTGNEAGWLTTCLMFVKAQEVGGTLLREPLVSDLLDIKEVARMMLGGS